MLLEVSNVVSGYYEDIWVIRGVSLNVEAGSIVSIIGPNGAGKSTLLKTIIGLLKPKEGKIVYKGSDVTGQEPYNLKRMGISYVPQDKSFFPQLTVRENLMMGAWVIKEDKKLVEERIEQAYERFPILREKKDTKATFLSGGQVRMLEIAKGIVTDPDLLILDEPSAGLQPNLAAEIYRSIHKRGKEGLAILLVDQNVKDAVNISDYVYMVEMGEIALEGPKERFMERLRDIIKSSLFQWYES
ncbi:MAG: ABC transporter ATP-binding protein [Candidatus Geothermarchaeales archaeon]